ncbi:MAG: hypothetical protein EAZ55_04555 [Cytophagales bacterium]|nr:MAG: hypothetical protein EAZ55_04555 [Cytophagales bacterium]
MFHSHLLSAQTQWDSQWDNHFPLLQNSPINIEALSKDTKTLKRFKKSEALFFALEPDSTVNVPRDSLDVEGYCDYFNKNKVLPLGRFEVDDSHVGYVVQMGCVTYLYLYNKNKGTIQCHSLLCYIVYGESGGYTGNAFLIYYDQDIYYDIVQADFFWYTTSQHCQESDESVLSRGYTHCEGLSFRLRTFQNNEYKTSMPLKGTNAILKAINQEDW